MVCIGFISCSITLLLIFHYLNFIQLVISVLTDLYCSDIMKKFIPVIAIILFVAILFSSVFFTYNCSSCIKSNPHEIENSTDFSKKKYTAIGDSITYGFTPYTNNVQMKIPYSNQVGNILGLNQTYNLGISGSSLSNFRHGMAGRLNSIPNDSTIISVMGGTNDHSNSCPLGTINDSDDSTVYGALNVICEYIKTNFPNAFFFLIVPYEYRNMGLNKQGYTMFDIRDCIFDIAEKYNLPVLNLLDYGNFKIEMHNFLANDGLHPTQKFVLENTAPQIAQFINDNFCN